MKILVSRIILLMKYGPAPELQYQTGTLPGYLVNYLE